MDKSKIIEKLFSYIVIYSYLLLPFAYLISKGKRNIIPLFLGIYGLVFFLLLYFHSQVPKDLRLIYQGIYTTIEYLTFSFFFFLSIDKKTYKKLIVFFSIVFVMFQFLYILTQDVKKLDSVPIAIETILLFVYIFLFFLELSKKLNAGYIYNNYCFWLAVGILIYLGGSFFFYILINHLSDEQIATFGNLTWFAEIVKNLLFTTALFIFIRHPIKIDNKKEIQIPFLDVI